MLVDWDKLGPYRAATERLANSPKDTFKCSLCGGFKLIAGRRKVAQDGRRVSYACKACQEPK